MDGEASFTWSSGPLADEGTVERRPDVSTSGPVRRCMSTSEGKDAR